MPRSVPNEWLLLYIFSFIMKGQASCLQPRMTTIAHFKFDNLREYTLKEILSLLQQCATATGAQQA